MSRREPDAPPRSRAEWERDEVADARERFARHELRRVVMGGYGWVASRRDEKGRWVHDSWFQVAVFENCIVVQGDIDLAAWEGFSRGDTPPEAVAAVGGHHDMQWVAQKASRSLGDLATEYVKEVMIRELRDMIDREESPYTGAAAEALEEAIDSLERDGDCRTVAEGLIEDDVIDSEVASGMGEVTSHRVIVGYAALSRLCELLSSSAPFVEPGVRVHMDVEGG